MGGSIGIQAVGGYVASTENADVSVLKIFPGGLLISVQVEEKEFFSGSLEFVAGSECIGVQGGIGVGPSLYFSVKP